mgnify:CR=1 FL=1
MRRPLLSAAAPACLLLGLTPVTATAAEAPAGNATATALQITDQIAVSKTGAKAGNENSERLSSVAGPSASLARPLEPPVKTQHAFSSVAASINREGNGN